LVADVSGHPVTSINKVQAVFLLDCLNLGDGKGGQSLGSLKKPDFFENKYLLRSEDTFSRNSFRFQSAKNYADFRGPLTYIDLKYCNNGSETWTVNLLKPTGYVMHHQFDIQELYALPTLYLCILCLSEDKQRLVPLTA